MMTNRIWALGAGLVVAAVLGLGYVLGVAPLLAQAGIATAQRLSVEQGNQTQAAVLAQMKADYDRLDELEEEVSALRLSIPGEVDSDVIYSLLSAYQAGAAAPIESITTGEAQVYGAPIAADGSTPVAPAATDPAATPAPTEGAATDPATTAPAVVPGVESLYTVPITIKFLPEATHAQVISFAGAMQAGPRLFLVTSIARSADAEQAELKAYMFVIADADDTPGAAVDGLDEALAKYTQPPFTPWKKVPGSAPTPTDSATPEPTDSATPAPTATGTPAP